MVLGIEKRYLSADELSVCSGSSVLFEEPHLSGDLLDGVFSVDANLVGLGRVVARSACEVASREDAVGTFASNAVSAKRLRRRTNRLWKFKPPLLHGSSCGVVDWSGKYFDSPQ
jgi:hypothetical protein